MIVIIVVLFVLCLFGIGGYYWYVQNNETIDTEDPVTDVTADNDQEEEKYPVYEVTAAAEVEEEPFTDETAVIVEKENENDPVVTKPLCVGAWENVGACTKGCGGGKQNQQWNVTTPGENCAVPEGQRQRQLDCNSQACPVPCVGAWENVGACTKGCGGGKQNQQWKVTTPGENCAVPEGQRQRQLDCNSQACTVGDLLVEKGWRTAQEVLRMSTSDQRNTMIVELNKATNTHVSTLQGKNNATLIAMAQSL